MATTQSTVSEIEASRNLSKLSCTPIAVIGMASLFPGAENIQTYWNNILNEVDCLTDVPASRWDVDAYYDPDPRATDKTYCKRGGFIPNIDFNPMEFGLPPNVLEATDVSQLLSLVIAKRAMEDADYGPDRPFDRDATGVVLGAVGRQLSGPLWARLQYPIWERVLQSSGLPSADIAMLIEKMKLAYVSWQENSFPGMLSNVIAGRIANRFDFGGLNCTLDAACASSLAALKMAISELVEGRANMMLTGGVDPDNSAFTYLCFSKTPALSREQQSRPFDANSDGIMLGEGVGMVVLKRLEDAEREGDRIYAVIKGLGTSSDGRYKSIYAPRSEGQIKAIRRAYEDAEISPATVGLIEAHGTGTMAGDPAEFEGLKATFAGANAKPRSIALGSVKSQIGHTKTAAGVASLIKVALALHHKVLPPTINITQPNPRLDIEASPFYLNAKLRPWMRTEADPPRRAGVSSFGFGGTNFHVVLEEYAPEQTEAYRLNPVPYPILLFEATPQELLQRCQETLTQLRSAEATSVYAQLIQESQTVEIPASAARVGFMADSLADLCNKLDIVVGLLTGHPEAHWEHPQGIYYRQSAPPLEGKVVALFSGQGSQYLDMGQRLAVNFPALRQTYGAMDGLLANSNLQPVSEVVYPVPVFDEAQVAAQTERLRRTEYAQPAIGAFSAGLFKLLKEAGLQPDFVAGHSFGELTALWAAGVLSDADFYSLVKSRGEAMATSADSGLDAGTMLAVKGDARQVEVLIQPLPDLKIANFNSDQQVVLAGPKAAIAAAETLLQGKGFSPVPLPVSAAFHTALVARAQAPFSQAVEHVTFNPADMPVYSNVTGQPYPAEPAAMKALLQQHMVSQVQFKHEIEAIYAAGGTCFIEFGPKNVLTNLVKEILGDRPHLAVALNGSRHKDSDLQLRQAVVQLRVAGLPLTNFDPYSLPLPSPTKSSRSKQLTIQIDGASYISEKTKRAFEDALQASQPIVVPERVAVSAPVTTAASNGNSAAQPGGSTLAAKGHKEESPQPSATNGSIQVVMNQAHPQPTATNGQVQVSGKPSGPGTLQSCDSQPTPTVSVSSVRSSPSSLVSNSAMASFPTPQNSPSSTPSLTTDTQQVLHSLERALTQFSQHQNQVLHVHEQYLENHQEYTQAFCRLVQQQANLHENTGSAVGGRTLAGTERSLMEFHAHQQETLRVHEQYLLHQLDCSKQFFQMGQQIYTALMIEAQRDDRNTSTLWEPASPQPVSLAVITAEPDLSPSKNGSAAPVQQNGAHTSPPDFPVWTSPAAPNRPIADSADVPTPPTTIPAPTEPSDPPAISLPDESPEPEAAPQPIVMTPTAALTTPENAPVDISTMQPRLLAVVSDKTGYPVEMLDVDMDMEADLGIDSIKRVEILGALQEQFPGLPQPDLEAMAEIELRTLGQVAEYMQSLLAQASAPISVGVASIENNALSASAAVLSTDNATPGSTPGAMVVTPAAALATPENAPVDISTMPPRLLAVVSDKTGYPVEMLDMDMDMEADLGIDSIKRVEILGALQEQFPGLPQPDLEAMTEIELRTLGQVADYMQSLLLPAEKKTPQLSLS